MLKRNSLFWKVNSLFFVSFEVWKFELFMIEVCKLKLWSKFRNLNLKFGKFKLWLMFENLSYDWSLEIQIMIKVWKFKLFMSDSNIIFN